MKTLGETEDAQLGRRPQCWHKKCLCFRGLKDSQAGDDIKLFVPNKIDRINELRIRFVFLNRNA